jgi:hypothetical protein
MNKIVNQSIVCALVIMSLKIILDILPNPLSWQPFYSNDLTLSKTKSQDLI